MLITLGSEMAKIKRAVNVCHCANDGISRAIFLNETKVF